MTLEAWALFAATEALLSLTPGPAVLMVLSVSLTRSLRSGLHASVGVLAANAFYFALSATSLGAVLLASWELFVLVKWLGAGYLVLPQFVNPGAPLAPQIALLGLTSVAIEFAVLAGYAALASRGRGLATRPRLAALIERAGGALLVGAGAGLATLRRD